MAENSKIEWTDHTFNPWIGCTKVSPGCAHCYAEYLMDTRMGRAQWGKGNPRSRTSATNWRKPKQWNKRERPDQARQRVFCSSLADWLDEEVPTEWRVDLLKLIHTTTSLDWLLLTKRPENFQSLMEAALKAGSAEDQAWIGWMNDWGNGKVPHNVWIGTSVEDQQRANERIPKLLEIPARIRFLSCEPLLGPVNLFKKKPSAVPAGWQGALNPISGIDWLICGGESGANARPMHPDWALSLRDQCGKAGIAFLFKQWGEFAPTLGGSMELVGKKAAGRLLDGKEYLEYPIR